jgi:ribosomal protein S18 acetylase RimI-like enzyme
VRSGGLFLEWGVDYRLFRAEDFAALYAIEEQCFEPPQRFERSYMLSLVNNPEAATWIAEEDGIMTGFGIADWTSIHSQRLGYIQTLEVSPEMRRCGVGLELLHRLEASARLADCRYLWLHVDMENAAATRLYERERFVRKGMRADYYGAGRPAAVYSKMLL